MRTPLKELFKIEPTELRDLTIAALVLAFCFGGIRWEGPFTFSAWAISFLYTLFLVAISIAVHEIAHRYVAVRHMAKVSSRIWWSGVVAALILVVLSNIIFNVSFVFAALWAVSISSLQIYRPGKPAPKWHLGPYERAKIAVSGSLANFGLAIIAKMFGATTLMNINLWIAVLNLFPFFTLFPIIFARQTPVGQKLMEKGAPYVEGEFVFFGSRPLWAFTFVFILVAGIALSFLGLVLSLILAFLIAASLWVAWNYYFEPK